MAVIVDVVTVTERAALINAGADVFYTEPADGERVLIVVDANASVWELLELPVDEPPADFGLSNLTDARDAVLRGEKPWDHIGGEKAAKWNPNYPVLTCKHCAGEVFAMGLCAHCYEQVKGGA